MNEYGLRTGQAALRIFGPAVQCMGRAIGVTEASHRSRRRTGFAADFVRVLPASSAGLRADLGCAAAHGVSQ